MFKTSGLSIATNLTMNFSSDRDLERMKTNIKLKTDCIYGLYPLYISKLGWKLHSMYVFTQRCLCCCHLCICVFKSKNNAHPSFARRRDDGTFICVVDKSPFAADQV